MRRTIALLALLVPISVHAQTAGHDHMGPMDHAAMMRNAALPTQPGQGAFAAIQEIVEILERDPKTDWSKVNIDALREHLTDMNNVTLRANVKSEALEDGIRFSVAGDGAVRQSIRRMVLAHAGVMNAVGDWRFTASETEGGAILTVKVRAQDVVKLRGLGFMGVMTRGMHHQEHHLMIARGEHPHH